MSDREYYLFQSRSLINGWPYLYRNTDIKMSFPRHGLFLSRSPINGWSRYYMETQSLTMSYRTHVIFQSRSHLNGYLHGYGSLYHMRKRTLSKTYI